jgi:hypothetical protein
MKNQLLLSIGLATLIACGKGKDPEPEPIPAPTAYTFNRQLVFPSSGFRRDTAYLTGQITAKAAIVKDLFSHEDVFVLTFGSSKEKDEVWLQAPLSKLRPNFVGSYSFVTYGPGTAVTGEFSPQYIFRYYPNHSAGFSFSFPGIAGTPSAPTFLTITGYDPKNNLISGEFKLGLGQSYIALPPYFVNPSAFELQLAGSFTNLELAK